MFTTIKQNRGPGSLYRYEILWTLFNKKISILSFHTSYNLLKNVSFLSGRLNAWYVKSAKPESSCQVTRNFKLSKGKYLEFQHNVMENTIFTLNESTLILR